ncbi:TldD/PmbA family protein [Chloroflexota bacterium]
MENILAEAKKIAEEAEVFLISSEETPVQFETNRLKHIQSKRSTSVALRIIHNGRTGYATTTNIDNGKKLVENAVETARFGQTAKFDLPSLTTYPDTKIYDLAVETVSLEEMIALGEEMIAKITEHTPGILCEGEVTKRIINVDIINSRGGEASYSKSIFSIGIEGTLINGTNMLFVGESDSSCHPLLETDNITETVLRQLELAKKQAIIPSKRLPVIFTPDGVASALIMPLMSAFNGKTVLQGASPLGNRVGEAVFDKEFSMWDNPTVAYRPASRPCDAEGIPSQRTPLVDRGTVSGFLYDLQTAALAKTISTGNGNRGRNGLPSPSASAFIIAPGKTSFDEMISDIKEGLIVEQLMGAEQGNVLGGDFSGNVLLGYKVENGKIRGRVKDTMVSGNVYQILNKITAIGSEAKWVSGFLNTPHFYCSDVAVASK